MIFVSFFLPETGIFEFDTQLTTYGSPTKLHCFRLQSLEKLQSGFHSISNNIPNYKFLPDHIFDLLPIIYLNGAK